MQSARYRRYHRVLRTVLFTLSGVLLFILALFLLKEGASGLHPLLMRLQVSGLVNALGFGWAMAYLVLSGSPVAAISLSLFGGQVLSSVETFGMITGSIYAQLIIGTYWQWDPKEVWSLITWLSYAVLIHERLTVGWRGRKAALISILCFCILIFSFLGASLWLGGYHSFESLGARKAL